MNDLPAKTSGEIGVKSQSSLSSQASTVVLPDVPAIPQKVRFFTARNTFIADSCLEIMPAIQFDAFIAPLFGAIPDINREEWSLADRIYALNTAFSQQSLRKANQQIYIRLDLLPNGHLLISAINPQLPAIESAIKDETEDAKNIA